MKSAASHTGDDIARDLLPSSPWLTMEQASHHAHISRRGLISLIRRYNDRYEPKACVGDNYYLIHRERLDLLLNEARAESKTVSPPA